MDSNGRDVDDELEELVFDCLEATDPQAELQRRAGDRPELLAAARRLLQQVCRLEQLDPQEMVGASSTVLAGPRATEPGSWPTIPGVELEALLGRGGQGFVFRGRQSYLQRPVAVKVLAPELQTPAFLERFRREARMLAGLQHPHIVTCHDAGVTPDGQGYLVMELIDGPDLRRHLDQRGALPVPTSLRLVRDLASALQYSQRQGLVHRDVKPENVLLQVASGGDGTPHFPFVAKLADLGLARAAGPSRPGSLLTPVGAVLGTPATMAPEQFDAPDTVDHRADIYGLGCILHHALTGRPAFRGTAMTDLVVQKAALRNPGAAPSLPDVPAPVNELLWRMLAWDPAARPQSYANLLAALDALAPPTPAPRRPRRVVLAVGALAVATVAGWAWSQRNAPPRQSALVVAAPTQLQEGEVGTIGWTWQDGDPATRASCSQTGGPPVAELGGDATNHRFSVPFGASGHTLTFVVAGEDEGRTRREVHIDVTVAASRVALAEGATVDPFASGSIAAWTVTEPACWQADESGRGMLVNCPRAPTTATLLAPSGAFALRGRIEPRFRYVSAQAPKVPIRLVGVRIDLADQHALALVITSQQGERFAATWQHQQLEGGAWQPVLDLGSCAGVFPTGEPLQFELTWSQGRFQANCGPPTAPAAATATVEPASEWQAPWQPGRIVAFADGGVAVFTDWRIAAVR